MADVPGECGDGSGGAQASGSGGELVFDILRRRLMVACARGGIPGPPPPSRASEHPSEAQVLLRAVLLSREALAATDRLHAALSLSAAEPHGAHLAPLTRPNTPPCSAMPPRALETVLAGSVFSVGRSPSPHLGLLGVAGVAPGRNHNRIEAPPLLARASSAPPEALPVALPARPPIDVEDASRARTRTHGERNGNRDRLVVAPVWRNDDDDDDDDDDDEGGGRVPGWTRAGLGRTHARVGSRRRRRDEGKKPTRKPELFARDAEVPHRRRLPTRERRASFGTRSASLWARETEKTTRRSSRGRRERKKPRYERGESSATAATREQKRRERRKRRSDAEGEGAEDKNANAFYARSRDAASRRRFRRGKLFLPSRGARRARRVRERAGRERARSPPDRVDDARR